MERKAFLSDKSHYAVIFTSLQSEVNKDYAEMDELKNPLIKKTVWTPRDRVSSK